MGRKLINVGTEDYSMWIPAGVPVSVYGVKIAAIDDMENLVLLKSRIVYHDGSGNKYDSPLPASKVIKLLENNNDNLEE